MEENINKEDLVEEEEDSEEEDTSDEEETSEEGESEDEDSSGEEEDSEEEDEYSNLTPEEAIKRLRKAEATLIKSKQKSKKKPVTPKQEVRGVSFDEIAESVSLVRDITSKEFVSLRKEASELGVSTDKFLKSKSGQNFLKSIRKNSKETKETPSPSPRTVTYNGKDVRSILRDPKASKAEKDAATIAHTMARLGKGQKNYN